MKRNFLILILSIIFIIGLVGCSSNKGDDTSKRASVSVTVGIIGKGQASVDKTKGYEGDQVMLTATADSGYMLDEISVYQNTFKGLGVEGEYKYPFVLTSENATVKVKFIKKMPTNSSSSSLSENASSSQSVISSTESATSSIESVSESSSVEVSTTQNSTALSTSSLQSSSIVSSEATTQTNTQTVVSNTSSSASSSSVVSSSVSLSESSTVEESIVSESSSSMHSSQTSISSTVDTSSISSSVSSSVSSSIISTSTSTSVSTSTSTSSSTSSSTKPLEPETDNTFPLYTTINTGVSDIGDPFIFVDKRTNKYYMYATHNNDVCNVGFDVWESTDLRNWTHKGDAYRESYNNGYSSPFDAEYWAPEVVYSPVLGKYIMYFSGRQRRKFDGNVQVKKIGIAVSDSPLGPFTHNGVNPIMFDEELSNTAYIDAHFFLDDDGQAYLLYCNDCTRNQVNGVNVSQTWIRKLNADWTAVEGAGKMISTPYQTWENQEDSGAANTRWNEAPALYKHYGKYYLMYSANPYWNSYYGVGCAVSDNIWGEYEKYDWNPILRRIDGQTSGPGHNMLFKDLEGKLWCSYHQHTDKNVPNGNRTAIISPAWFDNGILKVEYGQVYEEETTHKDYNGKPTYPEVDFNTQTPKTTISTSFTWIGDPFILADENSKKYYLYATSDTGNGYKVWESSDLQNWRDMGTCFNKTTASSFGYTDFWSPEVVFNPTTRKYIMYYTARQNTGISKIGVALSENPLGPFRSVVNNQPMFDVGANVATVDATLFVDDNGEAYLYYVRDCSQNVVNGVATSQIWGVKVNSSWTATVGEHYLIATPDQDWEKLAYTNGIETNVRNEAPFMYKHEGKYYLTYSANIFLSEYYAVGCAVSNSPLSGFVKESQPIMTAQSGVVAGPGHVMIFKGFDNYLYASYHVQVNLNEYSGNRRPTISGVWFNNGKMTIEYTK